MNKKDISIIIRDAILKIDSESFESIEDRFEAQNIMVGLSEIASIYDLEIGRLLKNFSISKHYIVKK